MYNQFEVEQAITAILGDKDMIEEDLPSPIPFVQDEEPEESSKISVQTSMKMISAVLCSKIYPEEAQNRPRPQTEIHQHF